MRRGTALQLAVVVTLVGVMLLLLGGGVDRAERQRPTSTGPGAARPATPQEQRQYDADRLAALLHEQSRLDAILDQQASRP